MSDAETPYELGPFRLDPRTRVLWRGDDVVPITPKAFDLLLVLVEKRGDVVGKAELFSRVWPDVVVGEANLSVTVAALRKALGKRPDGRDYIRTVPRRGYRLGVPVAGATHVPLALAVLPFRGAVASPEDEALGLGLADAVITRLMQIDGVRVCSTGVIARYAGVAASPASVARELGVQAVLDGTLQRHTGRVRVSVQLVPAVGAMAPWAATFDEPLAHVFELQDALADRVAAALRPQLGAGALDAAAPRAGHQTPKLSAYEAYLRGRLFWRRFDIEGIGKALACFGEAVQLDPAFARPHAGLADAYLLLGFGGTVPPAEAQATARQCASRALALDADLPEAHVTMGYVQLFESWDWPAARRSLDRALALCPGSSAVRLWRGLFLAMLGDLGGARREMAHARETDPLSPVVHAFAAFQHALTSEPERELELARRAVELAPDHFLSQWSLGTAFARSGMPAPAVAALRRAVALSGDGPVVKSVLAVTLAALGQVDEARGLLEELDALAAHVWVSPYRRAAILARLGEPAAALARLEQAVELGDPWAAFLAADPMLIPLRRERRYVLLERRLLASVRG